MVGFFLHCSANARCRSDYPVIWRTPKTDRGNRVSAADLQKYGNRGLIYEVAGYGGGIADIPVIEQMKLYDFYNYLAYKRSERIE